MSRFSIATSDRSRQKYGAACLTAAALSLTFSLIFWPWFSDPATGTRWTALSVIVPIALVFIELPRPTVGHLLGGLYLAWAATTLLWSPITFYGINAAWQLALLAGLFLIGTALPSMRPLYLGLGLGFAINVPIAIAQVLGWEVLPQVVIPGGLFMNHNVLTYSAAPVLVALILERMWWLAAAVAPLVVLPGTIGLFSRGPMAVLAALAACWLWGRSRLAAMALGLVLIGGLGWSIASNAHHDQTKVGRMAIWLDTVAGLTAAGQGLGSFYVTYPLFARHYDLMEARPVNAHNDYLEATYELGIPGIVLMLACLAWLLTGARSTERAVLACIAMEAFIDFPLHLPTTLGICGLAAGHICRTRPALRDRLAQWRNALYARLDRKPGRAGLGRRPQSGGAVVST